MLNFKLFCGSRQHGFLIKKKNNLADSEKIFESLVNFKNNQIE